MAKVTVTTDEGIVVDVITTEGHDLNKGIARAAFVSDVMEAVEQAQAQDRLSDSFSPAAGQGGYDD